MRRIINYLLLIAAIFCLSLPAGSAALSSKAKLAEDKPAKIKLAYPKILNLKNGKLVSPLVIQDCDPSMHDGTVMVFLDRVLIGVGGKKVGGTKYSPITKVTLSKVEMTKGKHLLSVTDGIDRSVIYWLKG